MIRIKVYRTSKKTNGSGPSTSGGNTVINNIGGQADKWFVFDSDNNAVCCKFDFYSVGGVSANGAGDIEEDVVEVIDNLDSTDSTAALSANQGHMLKGMVDNLQAEVDELNSSVVTLYNNDTDGVLATSSYSVTFTEDMSDFSMLRCYFRASLHTATDTNAIPSGILYINLNPAAAFSGGEFAGSIHFPYLNNTNRFASYVCLVSADKTQFRVVSQQSIYGTAATNISNASHGIYCYKIEGIKDL